MQEQFEPLKNDLLLRAARGISIRCLAATMKKKLMLLQAREWNVLQYGLCGKVSFNFANVILVALEG